VKNRFVVYTPPLSIPFESGLAERYDNLLACVRAHIYDNSMSLTDIAQRMGMSPSDLSRKLANNPNDTRRLTALDVESYIRSVGDTTPILYLVHKWGSAEESPKMTNLILHG
jgi:hypothetical protein